jgi:hypothetical protein
LLFSFEALKPETYFIAFFSLPFVLPLLVGLEGMDKDWAGEGLKRMNAFLDNLQRAGEFTWKYLLDAIRNEHKYSFIAAALITETLLRGSSKLANSENVESRNQDRRQELSNALTFTISFSGTTVQRGEKGVTTWGTEGEGKVTFQQFLESGEMEEKWELKADGQGIHTQYSATDPSAVKELITTDFQTGLVLTAVAPCFSDVQVGATRFGASELVYASDIGPITVPSLYNLINRLALAKYYDAKTQAVLAEMDGIKDGAATQSEDVSGKHEQAQIKYTITVEHTPQ